MSLELFTLSLPRWPLIARVEFLMLGSLVKTGEGIARGLRAPTRLEAASIDESLDPLGATKNFNLVQVDSALGCIHSRDFLEADRVSPLSLY